MKKRIHEVLVLVLWLMNGASLQAQSPEVEIGLLKTEYQHLSPAEIQKLESNAFEALGPGQTDQGFTKEGYWLKLRFNNTTSQDFEGVLQFGRPITDSVQVYSVGGKLQSGDRIPFKEKVYPHRHNIFPLKLKAGLSTEWFLYAKSDGETLDLKPILYTEEEFQMRQYSQHLFLGGFYGMLFLSALVYLFFYKGLREQAFLNYGVYVLSIALLQSSLDGFSFQYLFPSGSWFGNKMVLLSAAFSNFFLLRYGESFLKVSQLLPKWHIFYRAFYVAIPLVASLIFMGDEAMALAYPLSNVNGLLSLILLLSTLVYLHRKVQKVDLFFRIGMFFLVFGLLAFVLNNLGMLPNLFWIQNLAKFGIALEIVFLSLSMTNLIGRLRQTKEESQAEALRKSEEISAMKTYFMSNISHELRTPINAILGISTVALEGDLSEEERENYQIIRRASLGLISNVNDILDFEQIEKGVIQLDQDHSFDVAKTLEDLAESWAYEARKKNLDFQLQLPEGPLPRLRGDEKRLHQIINNLLSNAVKFTHTGRVSFTVKLQQNNNNQVRLSLSIVDTGIGMEKEELSNIFESFNQMKLNNKRRYGGLGLGLTIVKHLTDLFDAKLNIKSEAQKGTEVEFAIDLAQDSEVETKQADRKLPHPTESAFKKLATEDFETSADIRVLYAEDNKMNQLILQKMLSKIEQIKLEVVDDGQLALEALGAKSFDLVLMDLQMPNMDGYEACEIIRGGGVGEIYQGIPIIAITADATFETKQRVLALGMDDYMTKPVDKDALVSRIFELCGRERAAS